LDAAQEVFPLESSAPSSTKVTSKSREVLRTIADNLSKAGWSFVSALDFDGRTIWIAGCTPRRRNAFLVRADEKLTAFMELESAIRTFK
jgi:hypothetical protein